MCFIFYQHLPTLIICLISTNGNLMTYFKNLLFINRLERHFAWVSAGKIKSYWGNKFQSLLGLLTEKHQTPNWLQQIGPMEVENQSLPVSLCEGHKAAHPRSFYLCSTTAFLGKLTRRWGSGWNANHFFWEYWLNCILS